MKTYITPALTIMVLENSQMLAASTLIGVSEGGNTSVTIGGVIGDDEDFNVKGDWNDIWD